MLCRHRPPPATPTAGHHVHTAAATCDPPVNCMSSFPPTALFPVTMQTLSTAIEWCKEVKGNMYDIVVEGFQLLSKWTALIWKQCAWKFSRPFEDGVPNMSHEMTTSSPDYEKVVQYNYSSEERKALVELVSYIKSVGSMMQRCDTLAANAVWDTIHVEVQDFVQNTLATMLRTTFRKKDLSRVLSNMRTLSVDWMANTSKPESEHVKFADDTIFLSCGMERKMENYVP
ncbi:hypothetical protein C3L33_20058, partial [Rhododendron williamsianum]